MSRTDNASITLNFSLPPEVIKAYFEGKAKVESAKHSSGSSNSFDWSSLLAFAPLILPLLSTLSKSTESSNKSPSTTRKSQQTHASPFTQTEEVVKPSETTKDSCDVEIKPEIRISFSQTPCESVVTNQKDKDLEFTSLDSDSECDSPTETKDVKEEKKVEVSTDKNSTTKPRRPVYQDGDNVVLDLKDLSSTFGGAANGAPLADMMKMFGPMMEGLMGGMGGMGGIGAANVQKPVDKGCDFSKDPEKLVDVMSKSDEVDTTTKSEAVETSKENGSYLE